MFNMKNYVMKLFILGVFLSFTLSSAYSESALNEDTFVAYLSDKTTSQDLKGLESTLIKKGIAIDFSSVTWDDEGHLISVKVLMYTSCPEDSYDVEETLMVSNDRVGVIFKGDKCQSGVFNVTAQKLEEMVGIFFNSSKPADVLRTWQGSTLLPFELN